MQRFKTVRRKFSYNTLKNVNHISKCVLNIKKRFKGYSVLERVSDKQVDKHITPYCDLDKMFQNIIREKVATRLERL